MASCRWVKMRPRWQEARAIDVDMYNPLLHVVLFQPEIPYNTGSVGRTCVAVGAKLWLVRPLEFRVDNYHLRRAGMNYWQHLVWETVDDWAALLEKVSPGATRWLFTKTATRDFRDPQYSRNDVLVFGCKSQGLPSELLESHAGNCVRIQMRDDARSLNLSNSVAVALYEGCRQIGWPYPEIWSVLADCGSARYGRGSFFTVEAPNFFAGLPWLVMVRGRMHLDVSFRGLCYRARFVL